MDAFSREDRVEVTVSQLYELVKEAGRADLFRNGVKNKIPYAHILCVMDGDASGLLKEKPAIWHDAKVDPPKSPGVYYGKKTKQILWGCAITWTGNGHLMPIRIRKWTSFFGQNIRHFQRTTKWKLNSAAQRWTRGETTDEKI